jgi:putative flippase GtrA
MQMPPDFRCDGRAGAAMPMRVAAMSDRSVPRAAWHSAGGSWDRTLYWLQRHEGAAIVGPLFAYARAHASQLVRFVLIGAGVAGLNLAFLYGLRAWLHLSDPIAVTAMYVLGFLVHFPAHRWITYRAQDRPVRPQAARYVVMLVWNFAVMQVVVALAARISISPYVAVVASTGLNMIANFLAMTHIVFAKGRQP